MNQPIITKTWYEFTACWLEDARELKQDPNYTQLALAMAQWDENRPEDEIEYYLVLADNLKTMIDAKFFVIFPDETYLTSTETFDDAIWYIQRHHIENYTIWCNGHQIAV